MKIRLVKIWLCEACLNGEGEECHTPCCALFIRRCPDIPIMPELYEVLDEYEDREQCTIKNQGVRSKKSYTSPELVKKTWPGM